MIIDAIKNLPKYYACVQNLEMMWDYIQQNGYPVESVTQVAGQKIILGKGKSVAAEEKKFEVHKKYADLMLVLEGKEEVEIIDQSKIYLSGTFDDTNDIQFGEVEENGIRAKVPAGYFYIVMPGDGHKPCVHFKREYNYKKCIVKLTQE